jgi:small multidrug resistance pump
VSPWVLLGAAIGLEVAGTVCLKLADGFAKPLPSALVFVFYGAAFTALVFAIRRIDVSVAYAIWSGVGTAAIAAVGMGLLGELFSWSRVFWIAVIVAGVVGLQLDAARAG